MIKDRMSLYYRSGGSDKEYHATVEQTNGELCVVNFAFGRRGSTLTTGTKSTSPVPYARAKQIFDDLIRSKMAKGYTPGEDGTPYQHTDKAERSTGVLPMLCNPIDADVVKDYVSDPTWWMQEKFDGQRILIRKDESGIVGINRKGLSVGLALQIINSASAAKAAFLVDGECIGDTYHAFDLLTFNGEDLRTWTYQQRYVALMNLIASAQMPCIKLVETAMKQADKSRLCLTLRGANKEGMVFKRHDSPYVAGRSDAWRKCKFTTSASFIVSTINSQRSVGLEVCDGKDRVQVGNVSIAANKDVPKLGAIIEVRYLYAYKGGSVFQPVYLHEREDLEAQDCTLSQLKYKAENGDESEG